MRKALGRGIGALLPDAELVENVRLVEIEKIYKNPYQPREDVEKNLDALVESIKKHGVLEPILVKKDGEKYQLLAGERRFLAAKKAGLDKVPVRVLEVDEPSTAEIALVENLLREDLNPLEEAAGIETLISKFNYTHEKVAQILGIDRATVTNKLRLLKLSNPVKQLLKNGLITEGHAKMLVSLDEPLQIRLANLIVEKGLSVRELERYIQKEKNPTRSKSEEKTVKMTSVNTGLKVTLKISASGSGQVIVKFKTKDEFLKIAQILGLKQEN
uniref:ParB/RepB/Spo0J family partition protein n=1 Tax=candidate division WOR-3 bacterium TaxID=2052148 RepID=A0A7V4E3V4_UNCW3